MSNPGRSGRSRGYLLEVGLDVAPIQRQGPCDALDRLASSGHVLHPKAASLAMIRRCISAGPRARSVQCEATSARGVPLDHGPADAVAADVGLNRHQIRSEHQGPDRLGNLPFVGLSVKGLGDSLVLMTHDGEIIADRRRALRGALPAIVEAYAWLYAGFQLLPRRPGVGRGLSSRGTALHGALRFTAGNIHGISSGGGSFQVEGNQVDG